MELLRKPNKKRPSGQKSSKKLDKPKGYIKAKNENFKRNFDNLLRQIKENQVGISNIQNHFKKLCHDVNIVAKFQTLLEVENIHARLLESYSGNQTK